MSRFLELLAPVKSYEYGVEAIKCGADALYIGASSFGARSGAVNSTDEIASLTEYAHKFGVKVYVALNTVIFENELLSVEKLIWDLYKCNVDALIIQDMGICEMNLPPIVLHASTQTAALTPQRVKFLYDVGFSRVILERAASISEIKTIRDVAPDVELECFVFGAICVAYSGQCYMSQEVASRSGNRGECAQPCRSTYNLLNEKREVIIRNSHLLSLKDLNLDSHIDTLIEDGVVSFKIEGRLKDMSYLKNSVTHYNNILNKTIKRLNSCGGDYARASEGRVIESFDSVPAKTFSRGFTSYFIDDNSPVSLANLLTSKPIGELLAKVVDIGADCVLVDRDVTCVGGDGVCFISSTGELFGTNINSQSGRRIHLNKLDGITKGASLYRNYDKAYNDMVNRVKSRRVYDINVNVASEDGALVFNAYTKYNILVTVVVKDNFEPASSPEKSISTIINCLSKSGETIFNVEKVDLDHLTFIPFMPNSRLNAIRRELFELLESNISKSYVVEQRVTPISHPKSNPVVSYKYNVVNSLSRQFYKLCGAETIEDGADVRETIDGIELMRMKYCIRREIGECLKKGGKHKELFLENNRRMFKLHFDCKNCEMFITKH